MAGLIAARELRREDIEVLVLESAPRVGGRMTAETSELGSRVDLGGQWVGHGHHRFEALAAELGTTVYPMHTPRRPVILYEGRALSAIRPATVVANLALLAFEVKTKVREPRGWTTLTVDEWIRKFPSATARRLLEVIAAVATTADLDRISMRAFAAMTRYQGGISTMLATRGGAQDALIVEGAGTLTERLAAELAPRVLLNTPVTSIDYDERGATVRSPSVLVRADKVIVCVPPPPLLGAVTFEPALPPRLARLQHEMYMGSVYKAMAVYREPFWRGRAEAEHMLLDEPGAAVFDTSPPDGPGHLCILVGGKEARTLDAMTPTARKRALLERLGAALHSAAILDPVGWHEKSWQLDEYVGGGYLALPDATTAAGIFPLPSDPLAETLYWAGTETAGEHAGYIEGAIESGERVARQVVAGLR
ncbi:FAD-dependent oxidoreductase [Rhodococcus sp. HNM0569]|nr:FAD-dependent oxidoreductase [Rhodococcus sp. HNM0569]